MLRGGERDGRRAALDRMGMLVVAMIAGVLFPAAAVLLLASRDPAPRSCGSGQATSTRVEGALLYSTGADLWYSEGLPARPRKLFDYAPARPRRGSPGIPATATPSAVPTPSASAPSAPASSTASPSASPSASLARLPRVLAADVAADRKLVAWLVSDPPDRVGSISLFSMSPLDPTGSPATEMARLNGGSGLPGNAAVRFLDSGKVLAFMPVGDSSMPAPSPPPSQTVASPLVVPGSPTAAVVAVPGPKPTVVDIGPLSYFLSTGHSAWPDTRGYRVPSPLPRLQHRVDGPAARTAGLLDRPAASPLINRRISEVVLGAPARSSTQALCAAPAGMTPAVFSPDESQLALTEGDHTVLIDLSGTHAATRILSGALLAWRA